MRCHNIRQIPFTIMNVGISRQIGQWASTGWNSVPSLKLKNVYGDQKLSPEAPSTSGWLVKWMKFKFWVNYPFKLEAQLSRLCRRDTKQYLLRLEETKGAVKISSLILISSVTNWGDENGRQRHHVTIGYWVTWKSMGPGALRGKMHRRNKKQREMTVWGGESVLGQSAKMRPRTENIEGRRKTSKSPPLSQAGSRFLPTRRWPTND